MDIKEVWRSGMVRRWHSNPDLAHTAQPNGHHQWGCAVLALHLWPEDHDLLKAAILHDVAEVNVGDVSGLAKRESYNLKTAIDTVEQMNADRLGVSYVKSDRLKLVDMLEAFIWAKHHAPFLMAKQDWRDQRECMIEAATDLHVYDKVMDLTS